MYSGIINKNQTPKAVNYKICVLLCVETGENKTDIDK